MSWEDQNYELEQSIQDMEKLERAVAERNKRHFAQWQDGVIKDEVARAAKEFGLSEADSMRHLRDPNYEKDLRRSVRKLVERGARRVKGAAAPERKASSSRGSVQAGRRVSDSEYSELKSRAQKGQLSEDEILELMPRLLR